jgi:DNA polymerase elongation subunit (family B)
VPTVPFYDNPLLFGRAPDRGLVAFEAADTAVRTWARQGDATGAGEEPWRPFLLLAGASLLDGFKGEAALTPLEGPGAFRWLAECASWREALRLRDHCQRAADGRAGASAAAFRFFGDPVHQYLLRTGRTSFKGMVFPDLRRLALDIEVVTAPGFEFPNAVRDSDRIVAVALADSTGWTAVLSGADMSEADLLVECGRLLGERDPDVIEGHNIFRFDLEYIEARARRLRVPLRWGRDARVLRGVPSRMQVAERTIGYRRYTAPGRHIVDTWILAQLYDVAARDLESYGLKDVARHFGVAAPDRTYLPPEDIPRIFAEDPARLMAYARDDVLETLGLSSILLPPYFVQAQALPFDLQTTVLRGNATKVDALLLREYLHRGQAIPAPEAGRPVAGGHTAVLQRGVARGVWHVDVASLYPSIMLSQGVFPSRDHLGVTAALLGDLRDYRLAAKAQARDAADAGSRLAAGALQQTFKILINSFYGYLAFSQGHWNDYDAANRVTAEGRRVVTALVDRLHAAGARVIEVDTDGLYFVPPEGADEASLLEPLDAAMPPGIQLELAGPFPAMFSYRMKNYALLDARGKLLLKGSGLRSRGIELFQRRFLEEMLRRLLAGRREDIPALVAQWEGDFRARRVPVREFMKTETLQDSPAVYQAKVHARQRNAAAAYELALKSRRPYQAGDQVSFYVTGDSPRVRVNEAARLAVQWDEAAPDENTAYYIAKLRELYERFRPLIELGGLEPVPASEAEEPAAAGSPDQ